MTIDGEAVCEIDVRSSYLTIFSAWHGQELDHSVDPYILPTFGTEDRDIVKAWFVITFGSEKHFTKWPPKNVREYREQTGRELRDDYPVRAIGEAALEAFPILERWGERNKGWSDLMYVESEAMISTMTELMSKHSVPSLSVHDSLIVPASKRAVAEEALSAQYRWATGATPKLVTRPPLSDPHPHPNPARLK
jgi:hypothetical protein